MELAQAGRFAEIRELFVPQLRPMVSAEGLQAAWDAELGRRGRVTSVGTPVTEPGQAGMTEVKIPVTFEHGALTVVVSVAGGRSLAGIQLLPATAAQPTEPWQPPSYADPDTFAEQDVTLGSGPAAVPGTLSLPHQPRPCPAVVLLGGSGPQDRDETIGRNKPVKDLAWGLASHGVCVLRFDKVTYAHAAQLATARDFTLSEEYLPQAVAAVQLLRQHPAVEPGRVFVAGHSLGGTVAPRVAAAEPSVAGLIILSGGTQPLHRAAVRQFRYLASLDPATTAAARPVIDAITRQAELIDSPGLSPRRRTATCPSAHLPPTGWTCAATTRRRRPRRWASRC